MDNALNAVSKIFDVVVWNKNVPLCYFQMIKNTLLQKTWQLKTIPFKNLNCNSHVEENVEYFECGFSRALNGYSNGYFKEKHIKQGDHKNLHQIIHRLHDSGVEFENIDIEQRFDGGNIVDVLGVKGQHYIVVELGKISHISKVFLADSKNVEALWFGDTTKFIYSLSRTEPMTHELGKKESDTFLLHFVDYYLKNCKETGQLSTCLCSPYTAWDCIAVRRAAEDFLGVKS